MEPLTWTGPLGELLNPLIRSVTFVFLIAIAVQVIATIAVSYTHLTLPTNREV